MNELAANVIPFRRRAKSEQGRETQDAIIAAATRLLQRKWLSDTSIVELAGEAGVARASVLHLYPDQWPDVLLDVWFNETSVEAAWGRLSDSRGARGGAVRRLEHFLSVVLDRAEATGRLYANCWGPTFTLDEELRLVAEVHLRSWSEIVLDLLHDGPFDHGAIPLELRVLAEQLVHTTFDLAARPWRCTESWPERQRALRTVIQAVVAATDTHVARPKPPRRITARSK